MGSKPASRLNCSTTARASSSPHHRLLGLARVSASRPYSAAKLMLNAFAVGPCVLDLTNSAFEKKPAGGSTPTRLVASITVWPARPCSLSKAAAIAPPGTASSTTSAAETSPPSRPIRVTWWPTRSQRSASPPPTLPRPTTAILIDALLSPSSHVTIVRWYHGAHRSGEGPAPESVGGSSPACVMTGILVGSTWFCGHFQY